MAPEKRLPRLLVLIPLLLAALGCQAIARRILPAATRTPITSLTPSPMPAETRLPASPTLAPTLTSLPASPVPSATSSPSPLPTASALQLRIFERLWQAVNEDYLYPDFNGLDWNVIHVEYRQKVEAGLSNEEFYLAMDEMIYRLGDEHSIFLSPEEARAEDSEYAGEYDYIGIGVLNITNPQRRSVAIILIFPGSPAEEAGLTAHDSILEVNGVPVLDENGQRSNLLRGPEGTTITLTVQTPGQAPRQVSLTRRRISGPLPVPYQVLASPGGKRIGYILLPTFNESNINGQVGQALMAMTKDEPLDGVILDNRENSGGVNTVVGNILAYFTHGLMGHFINRQSEQPLRANMIDIGGSQNIPLVVLIGRDTASFSEIFAGILQDIDRAYLIGEQTGGNVEILHAYNFPDGSRAWIAHDWFRPLHHPEQNWEQTGITPDLTIPSKWDEITMESDPAVKAALAHFDEQ